MSFILSLFLIFFLILPNNTFDQTHSCDTDRQEASLIKTSPHHKWSRQKLEVLTRRYSKQREKEYKTRRLQHTSFKNPKPKHFTIPIIFHIIFDPSKPEQNVPESWIDEQIKVINNDFRLLNHDSNKIFNTGFNHVASNFSISFSKQATIRRWSYNGPFTTASSIRAVSAAINPRFIFNVWVCNLEGGILGFAYLPGDSDEPDYLRASYDGATIAWYTLPGAGGNYAKGRTLTHEIGHAMNLLHVWGNDGGCSQDDGVGDTPIQNSPNYGCPSSASSCNTPDNLNNYMDYVYDSCMFMFTEGQYNRVRVLFEPGNYRADMGAASKQKTKSPTKKPTFNPTKKPTFNPTKKPTTKSPTNQPTKKPTNNPTTKYPTNNPTKQPTLNPSILPTLNPTNNPTNIPTTKNPTVNPTKNPSLIPTSNPVEGTLNPTKITINPTKKPTNNPTINPTKQPSINPTFNPSLNPSKIPTKQPSISPTLITNEPTFNPSQYPTNIPTKLTNNPTKLPTINPTLNPTKITLNPSKIPTFNPSTQPTFNPTLKPSINPTKNTEIPTKNTNSPSIPPTLYKCYGFFERGCINDRQCCDNRVCTLFWNVRRCL